MAHDESSGIEDFLREAASEPSNIAGLAGGVISLIGFRQLIAPAIDYVMRASNYSEAAVQNSELFAIPFAAAIGAAGFFAAKYGSKAVEHAKNVQIAIMGVGAAICIGALLSIAAIHYAAPVDREAAYSQYIDATLRTRLEACNYVIDGNSIYKKNSGLIGTIKNHGLLSPSTEVTFFDEGEPGKTVVATAGHLVLECQIQEQNPGLFPRFTPGYNPNN